jgi:hypothetical protein
MAKDYERAGMSTQAREYLQRILTRYPGSSSADAARTRFPGPR